MKLIGKLERIIATTALSLAIALSSNCSKIPRNLEGINPSTKDYPAVIITTPPKGFPISPKFKDKQQIYLKLLDYELRGKLQGLEGVKIGLWGEKNRQAYVEMLDYPQEFTESATREIQLTNGLISIYVNATKYKSGDSVTNIITHKNGKQSVSEYPEFGIDPHPILTPNKVWANFTFGYEKYAPRKETFELYKKLPTEPSHKISPQLESSPDLKIVYELIIK